MQRILSKLDVLLVKMDHVEKGQGELKETLEDHSKQDQQRFDHLTAAQTQMTTDIALLKKSDSNRDVGFSISWSHIATFVCAVLLGVLGWIGRRLF